MPSLRLIAAALLILCGAGFFSPGVRAEPLDRDECKTLKSEQNTLLTKEVKAALAQGPDWVKDHLHDAGDIEKVRQYLSIEEKVEFRCRTDGVIVPKPEPVPLPDRKPEFPPTQVADEKQEQTPILEGAASTSLLPLRKPGVSSPEDGIGDAEEAEEEEIGDTQGAESTSSADADPGPSQTVADSDKTAPAQTKATQ
jgi:hypothetical protein